MYRPLVASALLVSLTAFGQSPTVKVQDIATTEDTSITIKKGATPNACVEYTIVDGQEEIFGSPEYQKSQAYKSWKDACAEWKKALRESNTGNAILTAHCAAPTASRDGDQWMYKGVAKYKIKTKTKDAQ